MVSYLDDQWYFSITMCKLNLFSPQISLFPFLVSFSLYAYIIHPQVVLNPLKLHLEAYEFLPALPDHPSPNHLELPGPITLLSWDLFFFPNRSTACTSLLCCVPQMVDLNGLCYSWSLLASLHSASWEAPGGDQSRCTGKAVRILLCTLLCCL